MTHSPATQQYREKQAGDLQPGDFVYLPGDGPAEEITSVDVQNDDYGVPALVLVTTHDGGSVRIAARSSVPVGDGVPAGAGSSLPDAGAADAGAADAGTSDSGVQDSSAPDSSSPAAPDAPAPAEPAVVVPPRPEAPPAYIGPSAEEMALIPEPAGTPESVVLAAASNHKGKNGVQVLADRLAKGINTKSGSCLRDLSDLAFNLCVVLKDPDGSLAVADLLNVLPFDGNLDRWASIERALALSSFICRESGQTERAAVYEKLLRAPESQEEDPFRARINARVRQRALNEPNLYDKEIFRAIDNGNQEAEREWRFLRLEALLFLRAHGGSETIDEDELGRRIGNELEAVRA
ncbi:hypothetical protein IG195_04745 [Arthrobacter sp. TES]|uniref:Uncharacterized protein n=1 Tax=Paenarthrobacter ureafaciens TaxID=37931 RepID=A0AAX3EMG8_PAEUR|nr:MULTISPECIES: DUF6707 family protein [Paenarthrobacter]AOY72770.1 hypothetical protein ARZXY2_3255 [Arthrobacter sp. ZXY-2]ERI38364.2 hypothetical protein M707_06330 [Arthrobacter sp. AK-YN10]NKR12367.1 hypothetical protein [Arthrobacter sp. M5]NKR14198.1 hypothetical protein [Arthrobacter sp. M6]OEH61354.1 hypothetical protein A5N17_14710 [Arthrobacter sp. D2]OEH64216.1 hypothetical protein A5N13_12480 [Arthrobacter sp. D4]QOI64395.1 hypothetical protein IG195_04745 [Arthrobacter sp. TES